MEIVQIVGLALTATVFLLLLRQQKPVMAILFGITFSVFIFWMMLEPLKTIVETLQQLTEKAGIDTYFLGNILDTYIDMNLDAHYHLFDIYLMQA